MQLCQIGIQQILFLQNEYFFKKFAYLLNPILRKLRFLEVKFVFS